MIIGKKVFRYRKIDSTNAEARRLIQKGEGEGVVLIAEEQTAGRGKPGAKWFSPRGNLYLSAVIKPYQNPREIAPITLLGGLAARAAIAKFCGISAVLKWPNDLLIGGRKAGGVLVERLPSGHLIVGIGINVNSAKRSFPEEIAASATSLRIESGKDFSVKKFSAVLISELDREYLEYLSKV